MANLLTQGRGNRGEPPIVSAIRADLLLVHAPAFFDFRDRGDIYFPYLGTSGDVPVTPLYEHFPVGFKTLQRYLGDRGHDVKLLNLATLLLKYPTLDLKAALASLDVGLYGIDLHWMIHCQGSLEIARLLKEVHPEARVVFGGITSTYYAMEIIHYPMVDMVMRGYDTHEPMSLLVSKLKQTRDLDGVPNLVWKDTSGEIHDNGYTHTPAAFSCGIDWSSIPRQQSGHSLPILEILSTQTAGCQHNCGWCGGSRDAFARVHGSQRGMPQKDLAEIEHELRSTKAFASQYHFYAVGSYNEPEERLHHFIDCVAEAKFKSISYEQFRLTSDATLQAMARANKRTSITLSPESHDMRVAKLAGRGSYTPEDMERWIERALDKGIVQIDVWYFIGMPEQDAASVRATVDYCQHLLRKFRGRRVIPMLCPMIPLLDPASTFFEEPEAHGYRVFHRTVEEHRRGLERASLINRINYETRWLSRSELVTVGYAAVKRLTELKGEMGLLPSRIAASVAQKIDDAVDFLKIVHEVDCIPDRRARAAALEELGPEIRRRNHAIFFDGVENQAFPIGREIGGRWFDEILFTPTQIEAASSSCSSRGAATFAASQSAR
jgi:clorobiocin biosynthesis protein CloN6